MHLRKWRRRPRWLEIIGHRKELVSRWRWPGVLGFLAWLAYFAFLTHSFHPAVNIYTTDSGAASRHLLAAATTGNQNVCANALNITDAAAHVAEWEKCDFEKAHIPAGWVVFHTICILIIFIALAIACDDFFVPSLEVISERLKLSEDVAGATFMAAGSSAPELLTSIVGVAFQTDVGVGTIVGSAVFNILIIIALTGALAGQVLHLDWRPLTRDSFFYALSIGCFIYFAWDGKFHIYEAIVLLVLYVLYLVLMVFNARLMKWMGTWKCCGKALVKPVDEEEDSKSETPELPTEQTTVQSLHGSSTNTNASKSKTDNVRKELAYKRPETARSTRTTDISLAPPPIVSMSGGHARRLSIISQKSQDDKHIFHHHHRGSIVGALSMQQKKMSLAGTPLQERVSEESQTSYQSSQTADGQPAQPEQDEPDDVEGIAVCPCSCCPRIRTEPPSAVVAKSEGGCLNWTKLILRWVIFVPAFPFVCLFSWTIPDCSKDSNRKWFLVSFVMSVIWIAILSIGMVTLVGRAGCLLGIDTYTMGLVIIAIGTSIPDAMSSILVARDGYGDMAVSNAVGSNVFDINLGLGLPFLIRIAIDAGAPIDVLSYKESVWLDCGLMVLTPHSKFGFLLLLILVVILIVFGISRFKLGKKISVCFIVLYFMFLAYAFVQELVCDYNC